MELEKRTLPDDVLLLLVGAPDEGPSPDVLPRDGHGRGCEALVFGLAAGWVWM